MQAIKSSALSAIEQGLETHRRLQSLPASNPLYPGNKEIFLIVVTYDHLYLSSNQNFRDMFGSSYFTGLEQKFGNPLPIQPEHVFFLAISEFESLMERIRQKKTTLSSVLRYARSQDENPKTLKFSFQQHLDSLCTSEERLPFIRDAIGKSFEWCIQKMLGK